MKVHSKRRLRRWIRFDLYGLPTLRGFISMVTEAFPAKCVRHKNRRHSSSGNRRSVTGQRNPMTPSRRHHRFDRSVYLRDATNITLCTYTVHEDVMEGRVPRMIRHVKCVDNGCRCRVVNRIGTYACTQLVTNMLVTINKKEEELPNIPYACVCASQIGVEARGNPPPGIDR
ncbi:uncharacterized protein LOC110837351 isoform X2 [Zootermopsis nevadensis]|uniref:uncharacterized protein LOC110837351 isoform X2 n=1 Tax=Zootermopsis nevadensis TaxID=136037 RepID=UPI000B8E5F7B|nr:uncharacterized protein LOC110837351 isoform X2 [Zootermopsis nevadensis]